MKVLEINKKAREKIKGARIQFACINALIIIIEILVSKIPYVGGLLQLFVNALFLVGNYCLSREYLKTKKVDFKLLFSRKDVVLKCVFCSFLSVIICSVWTLAFIIPGIIAIFSYIMYSNIIVDRENVGVFEALSLSRKMMKGHKMELFKLVLSFWLLILFMIAYVVSSLMEVNFIITTLLWIGTVYETPKYNLAEIMFYDKIKHSA